MRGSYATYSLGLNIFNQAIPRVRNAFLAGRSIAVSYHGVLARDHSCREVTVNNGCHLGDKELFYSSIAFKNFGSTEPYTTEVGKKVLNALFNAYSIGREDYGGTYQLIVKKTSIRFVCVDRRFSLSSSMVSTVLGIIRNRKLWEMIVKHVEELAPEGEEEILKVVRDFLFDSGVEQLYEIIKYKKALLDWLNPDKRVSGAKMPTHPDNWLDEDNLNSIDLITFSYMLQFYLTNGKKACPTSALFYKRANVDNNGPKTFLYSNVARSLFFKQASIQEVFGERIKLINRADLSLVSEYYYKYLLLDLFGENHAIPL